MSVVYPVVLAGGVGSRLWPMSRAAHPKQFLPLTSEKSLLQETFARLQDPALFAAPGVICHRRYGKAVAEQAAASAQPLQALLLEPSARNSGPAVAAAALHYMQIDPEALVLITPADHLISDAQAFRAAVAEAAQAARQGYLTTFGITPTRPETGFGYIRAGSALLESRASRVAAFVEKPDLRTAKGYLASGEYTWNSGMFLFRACDMVAQLRAHAPHMLKGAQAALDGAQRKGVVTALDETGFALAPEDSIDYAIMEKTDRAAVLPVSFGWSDIGAWDALAACVESDANGNCTLGSAELIDSTGSYCRSEGPFVAAIGVEDLVIVATPDAVLVTRKDRAQQVKTALAAFKARGGRA
ncbi:MAG: mannose-1-phosphate guanylyltransferase/mannose-6-phosphate isomerase [Neomegalonema sp.]|nr:mannose-1-phosphate guanylyltransferase/mannose-6-phosphate isomerase [Neomegalonema sp.]